MTNEYKFNYALHDNGICVRCEQDIHAGDLQIRYHRLYHFACLFQNFHGRLWPKSNNSIGLDNGLENSFNDRNCPTVTREELDNNPGNYNLAISDEDLERVREQFALVYDIPEIQKVVQEDYCDSDECSMAYGRPSKFPWPYTIIMQHKIQIWFQGKIFHPKCFKFSGITDLNIDEYVLSF
uniref:Uncharacterized protein n=1 Tax=Panagrolaimus sp. ES5 TaxID=591445 RepID=A0AC34F053_9BILA